LNENRIGVSAGAAAPQFEQVGWDENRPAIAVVERDGNALTLVKAVATASASRPRVASEGGRRSNDHQDLPRLAHCAARRRAGRAGPARHRAGPGRSLRAQLRGCVDVGTVCAGRQRERDQDRWGRGMLRPYFNQAVHYFLHCVGLDHVPHFTQCWVPVRAQSSRRKS